MKIYLEIEGKNPRTGLADMAYMTASVDDGLIRLSGNPAEFVMAEIREQVVELLKTPGVLGD